MARKPEVKPSLNKPSFFKILLGDFSQRLRIPPKFIENFNERSLRKCALRGPSGKWWDVELEKRKSGLYFHHGWQHFVKEYHLEDADLLIFRFDGEAKFKVTIYGKTACEKDVEVAERSGSPVSLVNEGQAQVKDETIDLETEVYNENFNKEATVSGNRGTYVNYGKSPAVDHVEATSNGSIFKPKNLCSTVTFRKCYQSRMDIPKKLAVAQGLMSKNYLVIEDPAGRSWLVELRFRWTGYSHRVEMSKGLSKCCKANQIGPGDTLVFEFVKEGLAKLQFFKKGGNSLVQEVPDKDTELAQSGSLIYLASEGHARMEVETDLETEEYNENFDKEAATCGKSSNYATIGSGKRPAADGHLVAPYVNGPLLFKSKNLYFTVAFSKHCRFRIGIPKKLAIAQGLMSKNCITIKDPTGRSWLVELMFRPNGYSQRVEMRTGLVEIFRANQIVPGDTLIFEFVKDNIAKVHILRKGKSVVLDVPDVGN